MINPLNMVHIAESLTLILLSKVPSCVGLKHRCLRKLRKCIFSQWLVHDSYNQFKGFYARARSIKGLMNTLASWMFDDLAFTLDLLLLTYLGRLLVFIA